MTDQHSGPGSDAVEAPEYTSRQCWIDCQNNTGQILDRVIMGYSGGAGSQSMTWGNVQSGNANNPIQISYRTGDLSTDLWYVSYIWDNYVYTTNVQPCDLYSSDDGGTGYIRFNAMFDIEIVPPVSSNGSFSVACVND